MTKHPEWVDQLSDADLNRHFGAATVARGKQYASLGRVGSIQIAKELVTAVVRGADYRNYQTSVAVRADHITATCSCPVRRDCKHAVALIAQLRNNAAGAQNLRSWRSVLAAFEGTAASSKSPQLGLQLNQTSSSLTLRGVIVGGRGNWVRAGNGLEEVTRSARFDSVQREALSALLNTRKNTRQRADVLDLGDVLPAFWPTLQRAMAAGIELVPGEDLAGRALPDPKLITSPARPAIEISAAGEDLLLRSQVVVDDEQLPAAGRNLIGVPAHGIWLRHDEAMLLGPLDRPLTSAEHGLLQHESLTVPASDALAFTAGYLPRLRAGLEITLQPGLELPEPAAPRLSCRIDFGVGSAHVSWGFRYQTGEESREVGLAAAAGDPIRDPGQELALASQVPTGPWRPANDTLRPSFLTGKSLVDFVSDVLPKLEALDSVVVDLSGERPEFRAASSAPNITASVTDRRDWFGLQVQVQVGDEDVPLELLIRALSAGDDHLILDSGTWFPLDQPELGQLRELLAEADSLMERDEEFIALRPEHAGWWQDLTDLGVTVTESENWRSAVSALLHPEDLPPLALPTSFKADLRHYQQSGFEWLASLVRARLGGILADEMGLGKTVQALALAQWLADQQDSQEPLLVVAPTSVLGTWASEAANFAPKLRTVVITATEAKRGAALKSLIADADIVVTSYTLLRLEAEQYQEIDWSIVLLDEAQFVKNYASQAYRAVRSLHSRSKVALTGTPLENNLMDLWSLLSLTAPGLFPDRASFTRQFRKPIEAGDSEALTKLHRRIQPLILRRTKSAVATELPAKQEQLVPVSLNSSHRRIYDRHLAKMRQKVLGLMEDFQRNRVTILRSLTELRQLALAPSLVSAEYSHDSAKVDTLAELLGEVIAGGHRALVFSQFTSFLSLVRDRLETEQIDYEYLDGATRNRPERITKFREGEAPVFLISLKAGGFGLTLTEADYVFILDPWWNPAAENQAIDRTHRIGQEKPVNVYRLVATDTIEEKVLALQAHKRNLFDSVVGGTKEIAGPLSAADVLDLLSQ